MQLNKEKLKEDMFKDIILPDCPKAVRKYAERLLRLLVFIDGAILDYKTVSELDKWIMLYYWEHYDELKKSGGLGVDMAAWFIEEATPPEFICRARRWLQENDYIFIKPGVADDAKDEGEHWRKSMGGG